MKDKKLNLGINELKEIKMTSFEKQRVLDNVLSISASSNTKPIQSPWFNYSFIFTVKRSRLVFYILVPLLIILTSSGVVFASQDVLPDSILYPIKVKVVEPIEGALLFTPKAKAKHESDLASTRLIEAEILASKGKLDAEKEKEINNLLKNHTNALNTALNQVDKSKDNNDVDDIVNNFQDEMNAHARVLDAIIGNNSEDISIGNIGNTSDVSSDIKVNKNKGESFNLSETARFGANKIRDNQKGNNSDNGNKDNKDNKDNKEKDLVLPLMDITNEGVSVTTTPETKVDQKTIGNTSKKIDFSKKNLQKSNIKEKDDNNRDFYIKLLDSETSIKKVDTYFKSNFKFNHGDDGEKKDDN